MPHFSEMRTPGGYLAGEVSSALQKAIRRGEERAALHWASELELAGYGAYVWKRLRIIASEDVGVGEPLMAVLVRTLYENWLEQKKTDRGDTTTANLFLVHAVLALARSPKSRLADHAYVVTYQGERPQLEIPDHAVDLHTRRGRQLGRGMTHFYEEGAVVANAAELDDSFAEEARAIDEARAGRRSQRPGQGRLDV